MKLLNRDTDYAVRALCFMASKAECVISVSGLVDELKIPKPYLRKIFQMLGKKGLIRSFKGKGGGFELAVPAAKITLSDIIKAFQGEVKLNECLFRKKICPHKATCRLRKEISDIERKAVSKLNSITIASLINKERR